MNAPNSPAPDPDELASALVDGLLSPEEAERARQDPAVGRRVEEIMRVRSLVRDTPPPPPGAADRAVSAAVGAFESSRHLQVVERAKSVPPAQRPRTGVPGWLAAAAVLLVIVGMAFGVAQLGGSGGDDNDSAGMDSGSEESDRSTEYSDEESGDDDSPTAAPEAPEPQAGGAGDGALDLGDVDNPDDLTALVQDNFDSTARTTTADESATALDEPSGCPDLSAAGDPQRGTSLFTATAFYRGNEVVVHVYDLDGAQRLVATDTTCADVVDIPYSG